MNRAARGDPLSGGRHGSGFTLVELLVALALAAVISVSIMFISTQARSAYEATVRKVDVYNRFRYAIQSVENDLRHWIPTAELEPFIDGRAQGRINSHWDPTEELKDPPGEEGVVDGGVLGEYDEFPYIVQAHYLTREPLQAEEKQHDAYEVYFRTLTYVDGAVRVANVEYLLADLQQPFVNGRPQLPEGVIQGADVSGLSLVKLVRYANIDRDIILKQAEVPVERKLIEVATNVTDFRVEYTVENAFASRAISPGFRTPREDFESPVEVVTRPQRLDGPGGATRYRKLFGYGSRKIEVTFPRAYAYPVRVNDEGLGQPGEPEPVRFGFRGQVNEMAFAQLTPGDRIFVFTESSLGEASRVGSTGNVGRLVQFPTGDFTVKTNLSGLLEFEEDIDSSTWNNEAQQNLLYKTAYLPAALRITLRIVDDRGENPKTMQREIWLRRRSR
jgi:prepilin-type N-terminal cleavage/methylation domain-containing protein